MVRCFFVILVAALLNSCSRTEYVDNRYKILKTKITLCQGEMLGASVAKPLLSISYDIDFVTDSSRQITRSIFSSALQRGGNGIIDSILELKLNFVSSKSNLTINNALSQCTEKLHDIPNPASQDLGYSSFHQFSDLKEFEGLVNKKDRSVSSYDLFEPTVFEIRLPYYALSDSPRLVYEMYFTHGRVLRDTVPISVDYAAYYTASHSKQPKKIQ